MNMCISVIIPAFNEAENLKILLPHLHTVLSGVCNEYEILVIDSRKSADRSEDVCKTNNSKYFRQNDYGYGDAFRTVIKKLQAKLFL